MEKLPENKWLRNYFLSRARKEELPLSYLGGTKTAFESYLKGLEKETPSLFRKEMMSNIIAQINALRLLILETEKKGNINDLSYSE